MLTWLTTALRSLAVGDWDTEGGDDPEPAVWDGGRYLGAQWRPAHAGRVGPAIRPIGSVVHETQMHPDKFGALVRAWERSAGACTRTACSSGSKSTPPARSASSAGSGAPASTTRGAGCRTVARLTLARSKSTPSIQTAAGTAPPTTSCASSSCYCGRSRRAR